MKHALLVLSLLLTVALPASAQTYTMTDLGTLAANGTVMSAGISANGYVTGSAGDTSGLPQAFRYLGFSFGGLGTLPGYDDSEGEGINTSGQVAGTALTTNGLAQAFLFSGGALHALGTLGGNFSHAHAVNDSGQVVGEATLAGDGPAHAFFYNGGSLIDLGTLGGAASAAYGINASGQITGSASNSLGVTHAFLYSNGHMTDLGTLANYAVSEGHGINASGQIAGQASNFSTGVSHAFLYSAGHMTDVGVLPGASSSDALGINDAGQIVGTATNPDTSRRAVLYSGGAWVDLNTLIAPSSGWVLEEATGINASGEIAGFGLHTVNGTAYTRAFLLQPASGTGGARRFDFNRDGHDDLLWHNAQTGQVLVWDMNDQTVVQQGVPFAAVTDRDWTVAAVGDMNGDGSPDLLWENTRTGQLLRWTLQNTAVTNYGSIFATVSDTNWRVVSLADFDGDGSPDILWENHRTGQLLVWYMRDTAVARYGAPFAQVTDTNWRVAGTGDLNGDGHPDLIWQNSRTGQVLRWLLGGTDGTSILAQSAPFAAVSDTHWQIVGTGDTNGDGYADLVWENSATGQILRWLLHDTTLVTLGAAFAAVPDTRWRIAGVH